MKKLIVLVALTTSASAVAGKRRVLRGPGGYTNVS
jgi:hypothetical protein